MAEVYFVLGIFLSPLEKFFNNRFRQVGRKYVNIVREIGKFKLYLCIFFIFLIFNFSDQKKKKRERLCKFLARIFDVRRFVVCLFVSACFEKSIKS